MSAGAIGGAVAGTGGAEQNGFAHIKTADFIKVLISELANQDPFEPQDSAALLEQLSSLRNIESQLSLQEKLEALVLQNQIASAGGLIGRMVSGLDGANDQVEGVVTSVRVAGGNVILELEDGSALPMDRLTRIESSGMVEQVDERL